MDLILSLLLPMKLLLIALNISDKSDEIDRENYRKSFIVANFPY
jgi:hypothetical protein